MTIIYNNLLKIKNYMIFYIEDQVFKFDLIYY